MAHFQFRNSNNKNINPTVINIESDEGKSKIKRLLKSNNGTIVIERIKSELEEIYRLKNPYSRFNYKESEKNYFINKILNGKNIQEFGVWVYSPWSKTLVHFLPEDLHFFLRTGRNKLLINEEEQKVFYNSSVAIAGLSVGSHAALTIIMMGGAKKINLADPDIISGSNLNRIRVGFQNIGTNKTVLISRSILEINPYSQIKAFFNGLNKKNLKDFLFDKSGKKISLLIEEMDNIELKINIRKICKKNCIPVIMATDNGDNIIVDVERYDKEPNLKLFNGRFPRFSNKKIPKRKMHKLIAKLAGVEMATDRMLISVDEVGKSLYSWPQLGTAATLSGSVLAYLTRNILLGEKIKSGRYVVDVDNIFLGTKINNNKNTRKDILKRILE